MNEFIPQCVPNISGKEGIYLQECVDSTFVSSVGKFVNDFQSSLCDITNFKHCEAVSSGTCGLHLSLVALGVEHNDLVIMPTYTFIATANAVAHAGAKPWLFDIDKDTLNLNLNLVEDALKKECIFRDKHFFVENHIFIVAVLF